jgi:hypothetical protein
MRSADTSNANEATTKRYIKQKNTLTTLVDSTRNSSPLPSVLVADGLTMRHTPSGRITSILFFSDYEQDCQMVYSMVIWYILRPFGIFCGHLVFFAAILYILCIAI